MKSVSTPNGLRKNFAETKRYCSTIKLLTMNVVANLPGGYCDRLSISLDDLGHMIPTMDESDIQTIKYCREVLHGRNHLKLSNKIDSIL